MPQESRTKLGELKKIYKIIDEEIKDSINKNERIIIMGDMSCKVGKKVTGNTDEVTKGGRLLIEMVEGNYLKIINAEDCCKGIWTREEGGVKSIIDYVITRNDDGQWINEMEIDMREMK